MLYDLPVCSVQFSSVQTLSHVQLFATPRTAAHQASLSITKSQSPPKPMSIELVMPSNHLILCHPLLILPSIFPSIRVFSNESALHIRWPKYWSFSFNISPSNEHPGLISWECPHASVGCCHQKVVAIRRLLPSDLFTFMYVLCKRNYFIVLKGIASSVQTSRFKFQTCFFYSVMTLGKLHCCFISILGKKKKVTYSIYHSCICGDWVI